MLLDLIEPMTTGQRVYCLAIIGLFVWSGLIYPVVVLALDQVGILAACLAMDFGILSDSGSLLTMMLVDVVAGLALLSRHGLSRLLWFGYVLTVPIYGLCVWDWLSRDTTFALVMGIGFLQIVVALIGSMGDGGDSGNRGPAGPLGLLLARRVGSHSPMGHGQGKGGLAAGRSNVSQGRR